MEGNNRLLTWAPEGVNLGSQERRESREDNKLSRKGTEKSLS